MAVPVDHEDALDEAHELLLDVEKLLAPLEWDEHPEAESRLRRLQAYFTRQCEGHAKAIAEAAA